MAKDTIADALGVQPIDLVEDDKGQLVPVKEPQEQGAEFDDVQEQIRQAAELGAAKLKELGEVASASQHPRAYEAFTALMKELVLAQKELLEIQKTRLEIAQQEKKSGNPQEEEGGKVINQNLFVGSTADFHKMLEQMQNNGNTDKQE